MKNFAIDMIFVLILVLSSTQLACQAFFGQAPLRWEGTIQTFVVSPAWSTQCHSRDVSLKFWNRDDTKATKSIEDDVIPPKPVIVDRFPPDVEHSRPTVDQDAKWMEQEATTELLSVFVVLAILVLMENILQKIQA